MTSRGATEGNFMVQNAPPYMGIVFSNKMSRLTPCGPYVREQAPKVVFGMCFTQRFQNYLFLKIYLLFVKTNNIRRKGKIGGQKCSKQLHEYFIFVP